MSETSRQTEPGRAASALVAERAKLLACVHCGLCLEACPTYYHTGDENDSPRGRLYLMRAVEEGRLAARSASFSNHIDRCLGCRACESACPAGVQYGQLLEAARRDIAAAGQRRGWTSRALRFTLKHIWPYPRRLAFAFHLARLARDAGLSRLFLKPKLARLLPNRAAFALALLDSSRPARLANGLPKAKGVHEQGGAQRTASADGNTESANGTGGASEPGRMGRKMKVLLFEGCVTEGLFARVNRATRRVLSVNGCEVETPAGQVCCGALHAHAGDMEGAKRLARRNVAAFSAGEDAAIVTNAGGCGAMLASYEHLLADEVALSERARELAARVRDVSQQLAVTGTRAGAALEDVSATYDASCHLLHGQGARIEPLRVMSSIARLRLVPLADSDVCCGGAGVYNLLEPELSARVLEEKMRHVAETKADILTTGNPGCHMQLGAGAQQRGLRVQVCHPVELLDESYRRAGLYSDKDTE